MPTFMQDAHKPGVRPNPSMEATNNGGQRLHAFAQAMPPLFAPHLQR
jgi:hypothetical protein